MLYIFQVDTGQMLCFEMDIAISTVLNLKSTITQTHGIPIDKQVLLVSGGEILENNSRVCNYAAGTDTNPIFLFNKLNIEGGGVLSGGAALQQEIGSGSLEGNNVQMADLDTINKQIEQANSLPPTYMSVVTRAQLAQHIYEMGKEITRKCEVLIHHQHLQHQGWAAVVANLDDIVQLFNSKLVAFSSAYEQFCGEFCREKVDAFVDSLDPTLKTLDTIKIQSCDQPQSIVQWLSQHYVSNSSNTSLHSYLHSIACTTRKTYDHLTSEGFLQNLQQESSQVAEKASSPNMKEINGLEQRLYGLDQLLQEAKHLVVDQHELTQAFHANVNRASDLRDSSIFPDLCASHQHQLLVMQKNHGQLEDIRRRCGRAKEELTSNLNTRLKWIAFVQKNLSEMGGKIGVFHESLKRLRVNVNVLHQVHDCEKVYNEYIKEVKVRGRVQRKLKRLVLNMVEFNSIVEGENRRREEFRTTFGLHFLSQAFSIVVEDKRIELVSVPELVEYDYDGDEMDDDEPSLVTDAEKIRLSGKVHELEATVAGLREKVCTLEDALNEKSCKLKNEIRSGQELMQKCESTSSNFAVEKRRADRLEQQVNDLKRLIDEFRVKEDENIRLHALEVQDFNRKLAEEKQKCEERVVELTRMLEFECSQKIKGLEESHKLEFDAMVKRFKLVNRSVGFGGSYEKIQQVSSPVIMQVNTSEDEDSEEAACLSDNCGSLERAVDVAAVLGDGVMQGQSGSLFVHERVLQTATRLHKLSRISISACRVGGEANLFYFNDKFNAFTVYLSNKNVHFLNSSAEDDETKHLKTTQMFIANVTDKEFCVARRASNRYNVPQGFHFYRVKCKVVEVLEE